MRSWNVKRLDRDIFFGVIESVVLEKFPGAEALAAQTIGVVIAATDASTAREETAQGFGSRGFNCWRGRWLCKKQLKGEPRGFLTGEVYKDQLRVRL